jgi:geranylgeranyl diphosphate/geranylgeranyl-bacteriochlorophyllide a reductase
MNLTAPYDVVVVGGGPAGAVAAEVLAKSGRTVLLLDRGGRIKPCGGAIPPRLIRDFDIPDHLLVARARCARMIAPSGRQVDIPIDNGFVGLVDRGDFDEWLRERAARAGAVRQDGTFERLERQDDGGLVVHFRTAHGHPAIAGNASVRARAVIGADGARSEVARQAVPHAADSRCVFAYHEIIAKPEVPPDGYDDSRCDVVYDGRISPDFYGWVFPHGRTLSIGTGSANRGFSLRSAVADLRMRAGLHEAQTLRREGAPLPMRPLRRWDNGRDVLLAGDAAGVVAPSSGEGIYYAMVSGEHAARAVDGLLRTGDPASLALARRWFMREHGMVFRVLGVMQWFWYGTDRRRERFVKICEDRDVQQLTFEAYMNKRLARRSPTAHLRIFFKDLAHLLGLVRV